MKNFLLFMKKKKKNKKKSAFMYLKLNTIKSFIAELAYPNVLNRDI